MSKAVWIKQLRIGLIAKGIFKAQEVTLGWNFLKFIFSQLFEGLCILIKRKCHVVRLGASWCILFISKCIVVRSGRKQPRGLYVAQNHSPIIQPFIQPTVNDSTHIAHRGCWGWRLNLLPKDIIHPHLQLWRMEQWACQVFWTCQGEL